MEKITYASLGSLGEDFHGEFEASAGRWKSRLGQTHPMFIRNRARKARGGVFLDVNPSDAGMVLGKFQRGSAVDVREAIAAAKAAFPVWSEMGWRRRVTVLKKAADVIAQRQIELAALLSMEVGKNRFESIAEVSETVDLILYYCRQMEEHGGYEVPMQGSGGERTRSVLKPYGVWTIISPFNFPMALGAGMAAGALVAGNTAVLKPASDTPWSGLKIYEAFRDAGLPEGAINFVTGLGQEIGNEFLTNPEVNGLIFTGSKAVGMRLLRRFTRDAPRPCITEMGGKNPAIVMPSANLDDAAEGVMRSAFGMGGQKCSACSRLYAHRDILRPLMEILIEKTKARKVGDPLARETFLGPLIHRHAVRTYQRAVRLAQKEGRLLYGGRVLTEGDFVRGHFVEPAIADRLPAGSSLFRKEYFVPLLAVAEVKSLEESLTLANHSDYGLTAGIFTRDEREQREFFEKIQVGVAYCNRRGGATTGAWPGVQSFGGWKGSGSSGKNALGPYYVAQFMREQSQTVVRR